MNGKKYIGKTINSLEKRKQEHIGSFKLGKCTPFYNALRIEGVDNFDWSYLCTTLIDDSALLTKLEIFFIKYFDSYDNGYNQTKPTPFRGLAPKSLFFCIINYNAKISLDKKGT